MCHCTVNNTPVKILIHSLTVNSDDENIIAGAGKNKKLKCLQQ